MRLLDEICNCSKKIYILGNGGMGTSLYEYLMALGIGVQGFLVNDDHYEESMSNTIKVSDLKLSPQEVLVIVAIRDNQKAVSKSVIMKGYDTIYVNYPRDMLDIYGEYYKRLFRKVNVDFDSNYINYKGYIFINPFKLDEGRELDWYLEARDNILPELFGDYSLVYEGSYFYGNNQIDEQDVVIDAGANIGLFSSVAAKKGGIVYAFEPDENNVKYLKEIAQVFPNIKIVKKALADKKVESTNFFVDTLQRSRNSIYENMVGSDCEKIEVQVTTIDDFVREKELNKVDFIKADIEGAERMMLKGATETIQKFHPKISICTYHKKDDPEVLESLVKQIAPGYQVVHKWKKMFAYYEK